jgi:hypothetical protein
VREIKYAPIASRARPPPSHAPRARHGPIAWLAAKVHSSRKLHGCVHPLRSLQERFRSLRSRQGSRARPPASLASGATRFARFMSAPARRLAPLASRMRLLASLALRVRPRDSLASRAMSSCLTLFKSDVLVPHLLQERVHTRRVDALLMGVSPCVATAPTRGSSCRFSQARFSPLQQMHSSCTSNTAAIVVQLR